MAAALLKVADDKSVELVYGGTSTHHPDLGDALSRLAYFARAQQTDIEAHVQDGPVERKLAIDATGRVLPSAQQSPERPDREAPSGGAPAQHFSTPGSSAHPPQAHRPTAGPGSPDTAPSTPTPPSPGMPPTPDPRSDDSAEPDIGFDTSFPAAPPRPAEAPSGTGPSSPEANAPEATSPEANTPAPNTSSSTSVRGTDPAPGSPATVAPGSTEANAPAGQSHPRPSTAPGTPYSGPVAPTGTPAEAMAAREAAAAREAQGASAAFPPAAAPHAPVPEPAPAKPRRRGAFSGLTVPTVVLAGLLVAACVAWFVPNVREFIGAPESGPESIPAEAGAVTQDALEAADSPAAVPGFSESPAWEAEVPQTASVTATDRGVLVVDGNTLRVLDPATGGLRYEGPIDGALSFAVDTTIDGEHALLWRYGNTAQALFDGETTPVDYELPPDVRISSAGTSVLVKQGNSLKTFARGGLADIPTPEPGATPMAIDGDHLISAQWAGPVTVTQIHSNESRRVDLEQPAENLEIIRWVTAGYGKVVTLWGEPGASANSGHRVQLVVHSLTDGRIASQLSTSTDAVGEANWVRGQGYRLAVIGPYLYSMETGALVRNGDEDGLQFSEPRGNVAPAVRGDTAVLVVGDTAYTSGTNVLAVTGEGSPLADPAGTGSAPEAVPSAGAPGSEEVGSFAIVRRSADRVTAFAAEQ